jgi:putative CocE/NonD family hydrolase
MTSPGASRQASLVLCVNRLPVLLLATLLLATTLSGCFGLGGQKTIIPSPFPSSGPDDNNTTAPPPGFAGGFSSTNVFAGVYDTSKRYSQVLTKGNLTALAPSITKLTSSVGGKAIQVGVLRPNMPEGQTVPVLLVASPYFQDLDAVPFNTSHRSNPTQIVTFLVENYLPHGYAVALLPVRGTGGSGGCYEWWSAAERNDIKQALDWLSTQSWSNGNIAMIGLSQSGAATWMAAGLGHPALKTIVPISSETDFYTWWVRNGTSAILAGPGATAAFYLFYGMSPYSRDPFVGRTSENVADSANCPGAAQALAASITSSLTGQPDPLNVISTRDLRPAVESNYKGSVLLVHGFNDRLAYPHLTLPWALDLEAKGITVKAILGQWRHRVPDDGANNTATDPFYNPTLRYDWAEVLHHWLDYHLKGATTVDLGPKVQVADTRNQWRSESSWPPKDANASAFHLAPNNQLTHATTTTRANVLLAPDPWRSFTNFDRAPTPPPPACTQCVSFTTTAFTNETRIAGLPTVHLTVTPLGPGGHVTAYLHLVTGNTQTFVSAATMDLRYAAGGSTPALVTPNAPLKALMQLEPIDLVVPAQSQLRLEVFQGGYGEGWNEYRATGALAPTAYYRSALPTYPVQLEIGGDVSTLTVRTFTRAPGVLFEAPKPATV